MKRWLGSKKPATVAGYRSDLADLAAFMRRADGSPLVLHLDRRDPAEAAHAAGVAVRALAELGNSKGVAQVNGFVLSYQEHLLKGKVAPRTVNRRLASIRSMLKMARKIGMIDWAVEVENVKVVSIRDTRGPGKEVVAAMMEALVERVRSGKRYALRDFAILRLLYDLGLRRGEVASLDLEHWDPRRRRLMVWGKKREERAPIDDVPKETASALDAWVVVRGSDPGPMFTSFDRRTYGHRLTGWSIWDMVKRLAKQLGFEAKPHGVRHTAITDTLDQSGGDIRAAQRFSRHERMETLKIYDDNRQNLGAQLAAKIAASMPGIDDEVSDEK